MDKNPFWKLYRLSGQSQESIAENCQITRPTLKAAIRQEEIAPQVKWGTMMAIAKHFGYRVVVSFEPVNDGE